MSRSAVVLAVLLSAPFALRPLSAQQASEAPAQQPIELQIIKGSPDRAEYVVLERFLVRPATPVTEHYLLTRARERAEALGATTLFYQTFLDLGRRWRRGGGLPALAGLTGSCYMCSAPAMAADSDRRALWSHFDVERRYVVALRGWAVVKRDSDP